MTFLPGQPVVCVDASPTCRDGTRELRAGTIYHIAAVVPTMCCALAQKYSRHPVGPRVHLVEIKREVCNVCGNDTPFAASRFRPVVSRETDISELQKLAAPKPEIWVTFADGIEGWEQS